MESGLRLFDGIQQDRRNERKNVSNYAKRCNYTNSLK